MVRKYTCLFYQQWWGDWFYWFQLCVCWNQQVLDVSSTVQQDAELKIVFSLKMMMKMMLEVVLLKLIDRQVYNWDERASSAQIPTIFW